MNDITELTERYRQLESVITGYNPTADLDRIRAAFEYAKNAHGDQMRKDGTQFVTHPLAAAEIVAEIGLDEDSLCAALLHDCIEDTDVTHEDIAHLFGKDVAAVVEGVTKLTRVQYTSKEEEQMENLRKMLIAMAKDIRVILIKIADRLHNMRTMEYQAQEKQREKALETMELYAPIAHRLGMQKIKWELEDLSIRYLDPIGCEAITEGLKDRRIEHETFVTKIQDMIEQWLRRQGINCTVSGRIKHMYSIYRKMYSQNKELSEVLDLYAFRVIVNDIADCYNVLGYIHELFHPMPGNFKDYIGTPKPNMYQSLHSTVIGSDGIPFEVQIRTWDMHHLAEYGIAAHWKYKEGKGGKDAWEEKFAWVRRLLESQQDSDAQDFLHALKIDMFADEVFVFTPSGDIVNLPAGATPIDFAYNIHSEVGNRMTGAIVNNRIVPYTHVLSNGEIVKILTSNVSKGPSRDWLELVRSPEARNKIRQWFKKEKREENIYHGKMAFESELKHANVPVLEATRDDVIRHVLERTSFKSVDDLYAAIGFGGVSAHKIVNKIRDELRIAYKAKKKEEHLLPTTMQESQPKPVHGVLIEGNDNCLVKFARCCTPVPGDAAIGYITQGYGVSIHRKDCANYLKQKNSPAEAERWKKITWANTDERIFPGKIHLKVMDRTGLIVDVGSVINALGLKISTFHADDAVDGVVPVSVVVGVKNKDELITAMAKLMTVKGVTDVRRSDG